MCSGRQRVEKTEQQVAEVERVLRDEILVHELDTIVSSTGVLAQGRSSLFTPNTGSSHVGDLRVPDPPGSTRAAGSMS